VGSTEIGWGLGWKRELCECDVSNGTNPRTAHSPSSPQLPPLPLQCGAMVV